MQKNFDLLTGQLSEEHRWELASDGAEWLQGACACGCFDREIEIRFFHDGKAAPNCLFSYMCFSYYRCIPISFRKRIEQLLHQSLEPTLSVYIYPSACFFFHVYNLSVYMSPQWVCLLRIYDPCLCRHSAPEVVTIVSLVGCKKE